MDRILKEGDTAADGVVKNAIVLLGADHKVGTSMVSRMMGERMSEKYGIKVLLVCLDGTPGVDYINADNPIKGIDDYKAKMSNNILSNLDFMNIHQETKGFYFIKGSESMIKSRYYYPKDIYHFLNSISPLFDALIVDGGSNIELGMTIGALQAAGKILLITDQRNRSFERYSCIKNEIISKLNISINTMIINKYMDSRKFLGQEILSQNYQCDILGEIAYSEYGIYAGLERSSLLNFKDKDLVDRLDHINSFIENILLLQSVPEKKEERRSVRKYLMEKGWI